MPALRLGVGRCGRIQRAERALSEPFGDERATQRLARRGARHRCHEADLLGHLEAGERSLAVGEQVVLVGRDTGMRAPMLCRDPYCGATLERKIRHGRRERTPRVLPLISAGSHRARTRDDCVPVRLHRKEKISTGASGAHCAAHRAPIFGEFRLVSDGSSSLRH